MINLSSDCVIILMWIIFVRGTHIHILSLRINLFFRINTIFIGIFYGFIIKNAFGKHTSLEIAICRKIKISEIYV